MFNDARFVRSNRRVMRFAGMVTLAAGFVVAAACSGGCQRTLFPKNTPRTQFENYDLMRNRVTPLEEPDVFGNPQPALRARLGRSGN